MRIISKAAITEFAEQYPDSIEALMHWFLVAKRAAWKNLAEVRQDFPHADLFDVFTIFNIGGNKYRLIVIIKFRWQIVCIRHILTHREYSKGRWKAS